MKPDPNFTQDQFLDALKKVSKKIKPEKKIVKRRKRKGLR